MPDLGSLYPTSTVDGTIEATSERHVTTDQPGWAMVPQDLLYDAALSANAVRIYGCLARHGSDPANCYPSHARIAGLLGMSERSIARPLAELAEAGWVTKVKRPPLPDGTRRPDAYHVHLEPRSTARSTAQSSAEPPRNPARNHRAESRGEREPVKESQEIQRDARAAQDVLQLVVEEPEIPEPFDAFWELYPRKVAKPKAERAWRKVTDDGAVMAGLACWNAYWKSRDDPRFVPYPATWLNDERWNDDPPPIRANGNGHRQSGSEWDRSAPSGVVTDV